MGMETETLPTPNVARRTLVSVLTGGAVALTIPTGLVVGWFAIHLQFFGAVPSASDHAVGAGAYGAATAALLLGALGLQRYGTAVWQLPITLVGAAVLGLLTVTATSDALTSDQVGSATNHWWDGAGGVLACPWTWWLLFVGIRALLGAGPTRDETVSG